MSVESILANVFSLEDMAERTVYELDNTVAIPVIAVYMAFELVTSALSWSCIVVRMLFVVVALVTSVVSLLSDMLSESAILNNASNASPPIPTYGYDGAIGNGETPLSYATAIS